MVTEGFGAMPMAAPAFDVLRGCNAREAALDALTRLRWGASRPELVVSLPAREAGAVGDSPRAHAAVARDVKVRVVAGDGLGRTGHIAGEHVRLCAFESGIRVRAVEVEFDDGDIAWAPVNNLEAYA